MTTGAMKVATLNASSIRVRLGLVLDWLSREAADVLWLQETKAQDPDFPAEPFREAGYHVVFRGQKAYAGVAIVSRGEPQEVAFGLDGGRPSSGSGQGKPDEARLIRVVIGGIPVVNTYVPQGRSPNSKHFHSPIGENAQVGWASLVAPLARPGHCPESTYTRRKNYVRAYTRSLGRISSG